MSILGASARRCLSVVSSLIALATAAAVVAVAWAQSPPTPKSVTIGTNPAGTVFFALVEITA